MKKKITDIFEDLVEGHNITDSRLLTFGYDQLSKLSVSNPGGVFTPIINALTGVLDTFGSALTAELSNTGDRQGATLAKDLSRTAFTEWMRRNEGLVRSTFGKNSGSYIEFFPSGLTQFDTATDAEFGHLIQNTVSRATQFVAQLGTDFKNEAEAHATAFSNAADNLVSGKGAVRVSRIQTLEARAALTRQLTINLLTVALQFPLQPAMAHVYADVHLLYPAKRKHLYRGKPAPATTEKVAVIDYSPGKTLHAKNRGMTAFSLQFYLNNMPAGEIITLQPGEETAKTFSELFTNADALYITNLSADNPAMYRVWVVA